MKEDKQLITYKKNVSNALAQAQKLEVASFEGVMDAADFLFNVKGIGEQIAEKKRPSPSRSTKASKPREHSSSLWRKRTRTPSAS